MNLHKAKATDLVVESLKLIVTIATLFLGALIAYSTNTPEPELRWLFYISLTLLVLCAILSILNINSLINKIYREEEDAIRQTEAIVLNAASALCLIAGLVTSSIYIYNNPISSSKSKDTLPQPNTIITKDELVIGTETNSKFHIIKDVNGNIVEITIEKE